MPADEKHPRKWTPDEFALWITSIKTPISKNLAQTIRMHELTIATFSDCLYLVPDKYKLVIEARLAEFDAMPESFKLNVMLDGELRIVPKASDHNFTGKTTVRELVETILKDNRLFQHCRFLFGTTILEDAQATLDSLGIVPGSNIQAIKRARGGVSAVGRQYDIREDSQTRPTGGKAILDSLKAEPPTGEREVRQETAVNPLQDFTSIRDDLLPGLTTETASAWKDLMSMLDDLKEDPESVHVFRSDSAEPMQPAHKPELKAWTMRTSGDGCRIDVFVGAGTDSEQKLFCLILPHESLLLNRSLIRLEPCPSGRGRLRQEAMLEADLLQYLRIGNLENFDLPSGAQTMLDCGEELCNGGMCFLGAATSVRCQFDRFYDYFKSCAHFCSELRALYTNPRVVGDIDRLYEMCVQLLEKGEHHTGWLVGSLVAGGKTLGFDVYCGENRDWEDEVFDAFSSCTENDDAALLFVVRPAKRGYICVVRNGEVEDMLAHEIRRVLWGICQAAQDSVVGGLRIVLVKNFLGGPVQYGVADVASHVDASLEVKENPELYPA